MKKWILLFGIFTGLLLVNLIQPFLNNVLGIPTYAEFLTTVFGDQKIMGLLFSLLLIALIIWAMTALISKYSIKQ